MQKVSKLKKIIENFLRFLFFSYLCHTNKENINKQKTKKKY